MDGTNADERMVRSTSDRTRSDVQSGWYHHSYVPYEAGVRLLDFWYVCTMIVRRLAC
jgi:hypothetical protein